MSSDFPIEIDKYSSDELEHLAQSLRTRITEAVLRQGGHLASSLGAVELCIALHKCFHLNGEDVVFFDVGHQAYAHKLLSGRGESFERLRAADGCSGFPSPQESQADPVFAGHAGVALGQAIGAARAMMLQGKPGHCIAVVGDGALGCGIFWEALNNIGNLGGRVIVVLNDNQMSISPSCGILRKILNRLLVGRFYNRIRTDLREKSSGFVTACLRRLERMVKSVFFPRAVLFQEFGLRYLGPVDGNDVHEVCRVLSRLPEDKPVLLHLLTKKGMGYSPAEAEPEKYHCVSGSAGKKPRKDGETPLTYSDVFGKSLAALAARHGDVVAVSAAMLSGTGMEAFARREPSRCFDVGMAEEYAVSFASGMAARGLRPIVALYSTFLQRALDNVYHDVCLNNLPVIFCIDRTGVVPDGPTHHGIYALPFLRQMPNLVIMSPADDVEMETMLEYAYALKRPVLIRYPRGTCPCLKGTETPVELGRGCVLRETPQANVNIWAAGRELQRACALAELLEKNNSSLKARIINPRFIVPFDCELVRKNAEVLHVVLDDYTPAGLVQCVRDALADCPRHGPILPFSWPSGRMVGHGGVDEIRRLNGLDTETIALAVLRAFVEQHR